MQKTTLLPWWCKAVADRGGTTLRLTGNAMTRNKGDGCISYAALRTYLTGMGLGFLKGICDLRGHRYDWSSGGVHAAGVLLPAAMRLRAYKTNIVAAF
jgi:hypothetical protein